VTGLNVVVKADGVKSVVRVLKTVEIEMVEGSFALSVFVDNGVGRAFCSAAGGEDGGKASCEGGFAGTEIAREANEEKRIGENIQKVGGKSRACRLSFGT